MWKKWKDNNVCKPKKKINRHGNRRDKKNPSFWGDFTFFENSVKWLL